MRVRWKPFPSFNIDGQPIILGSETDDNTCVLDKIREMPKKKPLSYAHAQAMYWQDLAQSVMDEKDYVPLGRMKSIEWISAQGYHIELTGSEYELLRERSNS